MCIFGPFLHHALKRKKPKGSTIKNVEAVDPEMSPRHVILDRLVFVDHLPVCVDQRGRSAAGIPGLTARNSPAPVGPGLIS